MLVRRTMGLALLLVAASFLVAGQARADQRSPGADVACVGSACAGVAAQPVAAIPADEVVLGRPVRDLLAIVGLLCLLVAGILLNSRQAPADSPRRRSP